MADPKEPKKPKKPTGKKPAAKKPAKPAPKKPAAKKGDTQEFQLGDDFLSDLEETKAAKAEPKPEPEPEPKPEPSEEVTQVRRPGQDEGSGEQGGELEELIHAETQEFVPPGVEEDDYDDADERDHADEGDRVEEPTMVAAAGSKITGGFKAVGRHIRFPVWARFLTASFVIVVSVAAATAASLILYLGDIAKALDHNDLPGVQSHLANIEPGAAETILILGSDKRPEDKGSSFKGLSDTTMLLRLDPEREAIALFSLPRDLKVSIPGYGEDKLNAAYAYGGPQLTLQTVQQLTGLEINHLVNVDFEGFARAVNAIDCVYGDVDRRYFNKNDGYGDDYEEIDLQPGYQALCGFDALDYARYRHTDNDVVRAARQQDFLREARAKIPPEKLFNDRHELISIFTEHTSSDINSPSAMLEVLKQFLAAREAPIKEVHFEGTLGPSFVTATQAEIDKAVNQFLGVEDTPGARGDTAAPAAPVAPEQAPDSTGSIPAAGSKAKNKGGGDGGVDSDTDLTPSTYGKELAKGIRSRKVKLPIYYPSVLESGSDYDQKPRVYKINGTGDGSPPDSERAAYKWVFARPALGEYYGFMATRWKDPPILDEPSETRTIGGRDYQFFYDGDRLRIVAWQTDEGSFWLSNTLIQSLSDGEMLEIAKGMRELPKGGGG